MGARIKKARKNPPRRLRKDHEKPSGESHYGRKHRLRRRGVFSIFSPFFDPHIHRGYDPRSL